MYICTLALQRGRGPFAAAGGARWVTRLPPAVQPAGGQGTGWHLHSNCAHTKQAKELLLQVKQVLLPQEYGPASPQGSLRRGGGRNRHSASGNHRLPLPAGNHAHAKHTPQQEEAAPAEPPGRLTASARSCSMQRIDSWARGRCDMGPQRCSGMKTCSRAQEPSNHTSVLTGGSPPRPVHPCRGSAKLCSALASPPC